MDNQALNLHPLWAQEYWMLTAMFDGDPDVEIGPADAENHSCKVTFKSQRKADIFTKFISTNDLTTTVEVVDTTTNSEKELAELFSTNPHFSRYYASSATPFPCTAAMFKAECMHYFSDDMFSPSGHTAITARDLAKILFCNSKANFQTDFED